MGILTPRIVERMIETAVAPIRRRVQLMVGRAVLRAASDGSKMQTVNVGLLHGEEEDGVEHFQQFGITGVPPAGSEGLYLSIMGDRSHGAVICVSDRGSRPRNLASGEVEVYNDRGVSIHLATDGSVSVTPALAGKVLLGSGSATDATVTADKLIAYLVSIIGAAGVTPGDGGASFKLALTTALGLPGVSSIIGATKVNAT